MKQILLTTSIFFLFSCNNTENKTTDNAINATTETVKTEAEKTATIDSNKKQEPRTQAPKNPNAVPDFTALDVNDKPVTLSKFYAGKKLVLIDFWASWCKPCRMENPNVVAAYNKFKNKGFDIIGVSMDATKNNWTQAIAQDHLTWTNVSDLKYWDSEYAKLYGIQSIPSNFLIDGNGNLIAQDLRGEDLENKLAELLK